MWRALPTLLFGALLLAGCGSFGLDPTVAQGGQSWIDITPTGEVQFGPASPSGKSVSQDVTVVASGDSDAVVTDAWIEATSAGVFVLPTELPFPRLIPAGGEVPLHVKFHPLAQGDFRATMVVEIEDGTVVERVMTGVGCGDSDDNGTCD